MKNMARCDVPECTNAAGAGMFRSGPLEDEDTALGDSAGESKRG